MRMFIKINDVYVEKQVEFAIPIMNWYEFIQRIQTVWVLERTEVIHQLLYEYIPKDASNFEIWIAYFHAMQIQRQNNTNANIKCL